MPTKPEKYSYTKIDQYNNCPFAFWLKYKQGHYVGGLTANIAVGTLVHHILEQEAKDIINGRKINYNALKTTFTDACLSKKNKWDKKELYGTKKLAQMFPDEWYDTNTKSGKSFDQKAEEFLDNGIYRLEKYMKEHSDQELIGVEIPFEFEYRGYLFNGFIDRLLRVKGTNKYIIHDIKTRDSLFTDTSTCLQFVVYALALQRMYGEDIEFECYYDLPIIDTIQPVCTPGFIVRGEKKINKLLDSIEANEFKPKPSPLCFWCAYRLGGATKDELCEELCPYYSLWTRDNKSFKTKMEWTGLEDYPSQLKKMKDLDAIDGLDGDDIEI